MEHIIQFGITIDDEAIRQRVEAQALDKAAEKIVAQIRERMPKLYSGSTDWQSFAYKAFTKFIEDNKEKIMDLLADRLWESTRRTKAYKEAVERGLADGPDRD